MQPSSPFDRMKASLFRPKPDSALPQKKRSLGRILSSSSRSRLSGDLSTTASAAAPPPLEPVPQLTFPLNPHTSPASSASKPLARSDDSLIHSAANVALGDPAFNLDSDTSHVYTELSAFDERDMKRKLMDMESSFLQGVPSSDDNPSAPIPHASSTSRHHDPTKSSSHSRALSASSMTNPGDPPRALHFHRPLSYIRNDSGKAFSDSGDPTTLQHSLSSPSEAAAHRSQKRLAANARPSSHLSGAPPQNRNSLPPQLEGGLSHSADAPTAQPDDESKENHSSALPSKQTSDSNNRHSVGAASKVSDAPSESLKPAPGKVPDFINTRRASQRSSGSSFISFEAASDLGYSGSGGATPASFSTVRPGSNRLSRLPSLGSVASSMSALTERERKRNSNGAPLGPQEPNLETLAEERARSQPVPDTPQIARPRDADPSQTVLAQRVRDVEVPTTVARKFRAANPQSSSAGKSSVVSPLFGRVKNELTLKEQNSRIDKLSKENFDLKLKIHYLYQALQDRSDEGVKDLISKNAQLQTDIVKYRKDNQSLKKRVHELERDLRTREDGISTSRTTTADESDEALSSRSFRQAQFEDEILYLRDRMQALEEDNDRLRLGDAAHKIDGQQFTERLRALNLDPNSEQIEGLQAELSEERLARERAVHEAEQLRLELSRLGNNQSPVRNMILSHDAHRGQDLDSLSGTTLVDQLKSENANLRRDLGAQTSMLSSRNRERERLQQEIEDLKLLQRRGDLLQPSAASVSGDSILDRSVSRNAMRPASQDGAMPLSETERDEFETREAQLRDENAALRMRNQDLQKDLDLISNGAEHLVKLRSEHDDAVRLLEEEREATSETIDGLEDLIDQKDQEVHQLLSDLRNREDEAHALEVEIREISSSLSRVVDDSEARETHIQELEQDLAIANGDLESVEQSRQDVQAAKERLEVQAESSQSEIAFLREEQESDKIKISDLQAAVDRAKINLRGEKERLQEIEELEEEASRAKDEARQLRKQLENKQEEASSHQEGLVDFERNLRQALGNSQVARPGLVTQVRRLQRDLDNSLRDLNRAKAHMAEKERQMDESRSLAETHNTEAERLHNMLNKERQARRQDRAELDRIRQQGPNDVTRVIELERELKRERQQLSSLEEDYQFHLRERSKLLYNVWTRVAALCGSDWMTVYARDQGQDPPTFESVTADPTSIDEPLSLALDTLSHNLSAFRTRMRATEKELYAGLETLAYDLEERSKRIEILENTITRRRQGERASPTTPNSARTGPPADVTTLKEENKLLRRELKMLREANFALPGLRSPQAELDRTAVAVAALERERERLNTMHSRPSSSRRSEASPTPQGRKADGALGEQGRARENSVVQRRPSNMERSQGTTDASGGSTTRDSSTGGSVNGGHRNLALSEQRWILQLKELERRLKVEREGRILDRDGARQRLQQGNAERDSLRRELEREREKTRLQVLREGVESQASSSARGRRLARDRDDRSIASGGTNEKAPY